MQCVLGLTLGVQALTFDISYTNVWWQSNCDNFLDKYCKNLISRRRSSGCRRWFIHYGQEIKWWSDHFPDIFNQETKTSLHFSLDNIIFSTAGFKIIDNFIFLELELTLRCSFWNYETLVSWTKKQQQEGLKRMNKTLLLFCKLFDWTKH